VCVEIAGNVSLARVDVCPCLKMADVTYHFSCIHNVVHLNIEIYYIHTICGLSTEINVELKSKSIARTKAVHHKNVEIQAKTNNKSILPFIMLMYMGNRFDFDINFKVYLSNSMVDLYISPRFSYGQWISKVTFSI